MTAAASPHRLQTARLSFRVGGGAMVGLVFFLAVVTVVPFGVGPDLNLLARIGPAILWVGALLATLLGLDRLFQDDRDDGSLDLLALSDLPLELVVLAKCAGAWLATGLPLVIVDAVPRPVARRRAGAARRATLTLLVGTPALTLIGAIGAALMARHRPRRPAGGGDGPAVHDPGADLRGQRRLRGRPCRPVRAAVPDPVALTLVTAVVAPSPAAAALQVGAGLSGRIAAAGPGP